MEGININQLEKTKDYYNKYGEKEWERLDKTPYDRLNFVLHMDFIEKSLVKGVNLCDIGCGAGRFSVEFAKRGCKVTLLDISEEQIRLANQKLNDFELEKQIVSSNIGDISNMEMFNDNTFDVTVCYGAPLNYLFDNYIDGIKELYRITKPNGTVFVSVNSRLGVIHSLIGREGFDIVDFMSKPDYWYINQVVDEGDLPEHPQVAHPPRHMFEAKELKDIFQKVGFSHIEMASSPCLIAGLSHRTEQISKNTVAWETLVNLELKTYKKESTLDLGEFLLIKGIK